MDGEENVTVKILEDVNEEIILLARVRGANKDINQDEEKSHYNRAHWARATIKIRIKIVEAMESCMALIDHGFEINIMSC